MKKSTAKDESGAKPVSVRLDADLQTALFDAAMTISAAKRKVFSITHVLKLWIDLSRDIFFAKTREERYAAADRLSALNPDNEGK